jgi:hypothetical protein
MARALERLRPKEETSVGICSFAPKHNEDHCADTPQIETNRSTRGFTAATVATRFYTRSVRKGTGVHGFTLLHRAIKLPAVTVCNAATMQVAMSEATLQ